MAGSSAITLVTKSGTNQIHGSAFEFNNNQHFNSRAFFQAAGTAKPLSHLQQFRRHHRRSIKKNKLFYFLSFDGTRQRQASPGILHGSHRRLQVRQFQRGFDVIYDPEHGRRRRLGPHAVCRKYHSVQSHRFDRTEDPELLPGGQLRWTNVVREQLFCVRRTDPEPQLPGCQGELHRQRQATDLGQIRTDVGEVGRHRRIRHRGRSRPRRRRSRPRRYAHPGGHDRPFAHARLRIFCSMACSATSARVST